MQRVKILWVGLLLLTLSACSHPSPPIVMHDSQGNSVTAAGLKNKWVIINYWAEWCDSCVKEIPELNRYYQLNKDKNITVIGYNFDRLSQPELNQVIKKMKIVYPVLIDNPKQAWALPDVDALPTTFIINPQGQLVTTLYGPHTVVGLTEVFHKLQQKNST